MTGAVGAQLDLIDRLALDPVGPDRFTGSHPAERPRVFGGLFLGQATRAAQQTVAGPRPVRAVHASFLAAGVPGAPIHYTVERTRDGASFSTRRVTAAQVRPGRGDPTPTPTLVLTADFHDPEDGPAWEPEPPDGVAGPEGLPAGRYDSPWFDARDVPPDSAPGAPTRAWYRARRRVPDDPLLHLQCLAYLSDHGPTRAARQPHPDLDVDGARQSVTLDHSVWFHGPVDVNGWLLTELRAAVTGHARGLATGTIRDGTGRVVASVAQQVLLRRHR